MSQHRVSSKIAASILAADFGCLADAVRDAEQGGADAIHIDTMDGHHVRNIRVRRIPLKTPGWQ